jgi:hypothetical protein
MKHLLLTIIAAVVLVGCGPSEPPDIHDAAYDGNIKAVKQHLDAGMDVNTKDDDGDTPLIHAASMMYRAENKEIVELLITKGADVNAENFFCTSMHYAAHSGHKEIVELLIANGANVNPKAGGEAGTPLDFAMERNRSEIADLLRKHGGKTGTELKAEGKPSSTYRVRIIQSYDIRILKSPDDDTQYILEPAQVTLELGSNAVPVPDLTSPSVVKVVLDATDIPAGINETNKQVRVLVPEGTIIKGINPENVKVTRVVEYPEMPKPRIPQR